VRMLPNILPVIESIRHTVYVEPFCGGATVLFNKPISNVTNYRHYREVINDTSDLLINFYRVAQERPDDLLLKINATLYSESDRKRSNDILGNSEKYDDLTLAWAYYVNICQSFSNVLNGGWSRNVYGHNNGATWNNQKQRLHWYLDRLSSVYVSSQEALICIEQWDSPQTLFYLDPPYPNTSQGHYSGYTMDDWSALCELLDSIDGSYVLSNYPQQIEPKSAQQRLEFRSVASSSSKGQTGKNRDKTRKANKEELGNRERTEVLWVCDRSHAMRDELTALFDKRYVQLTIL